MTHHVTGRTFDHRELLSDMGGWFNRPEKRWEFEYLTERDIEKLRGTVGLIVTNVTATTRPKPKPSSNLGDLLAALLDDDDDYIDHGGNSVIYGDDPLYHNHFAPQNPFAYFGFSSLAAFTKYVADTPNHDPSIRAREGWSSAAGWSGADTMLEALTLARDGWLEGADRAADVIDRLFVDRPERKHRKVSIAGGSVSVGRMLAGNPMHMIKRPKQPGSKIITLFVEAGCNANINADSMIIRAAIIGAIVDLMEDQSYACTVVAVDTSVQGGSVHYQLAVTLKEAGERLNIADMIFALGHPAFLRRFSFAACASAKECRDIWFGMGSAANAFNKDHRCKANEFYVPVLRNNINDSDLIETMNSIKPDGLPLEIKEHL